MAESGGLIYDASGGSDVASTVNDLASKIERETEQIWQTIHHNDRQQNQAALDLGEAIRELKITNNGLIGDLGALKESTDYRVSRLKVWLAVTTGTTIGLLITQVLEYL